MDLIIPPTLEYLVASRNRAASEPQIDSQGMMAPQFPVQYPPSVQEHGPYRTYQHESALKHTVGMGHQSQNEYNPNPVQGLQHSTKFESNMMSGPPMGAGPQSNQFTVPRRLQTGVPISPNLIHSGNQNQDLPTGGWASTSNGITNTGANSQLKNESFNPVSQSNPTASGLDFTTPPILYELSDLLEKNKTQASGFQNNSGEQSFPITPKKDLELPAALNSSALSNQSLTSSTRKRSAEIDFISGNNDDDSNDSPPMPKRKRGRPKGSLNKRPVQQESLPFSITHGQKSRPAGRSQVDGSWPESKEHKAQRLAGLMPDLNFATVDKTATVSTSANCQKALKRIADVPEDFFILTENGMKEGKGKGIAEVEGKEGQEGDEEDEEEREADLFLNPGNQRSKGVTIQDGPLDLPQPVVTEPSPRDMSPSGDLDFQSEFDWNLNVSASPEEIIIPECPPHVLPDIWEDLYRGWYKLRHTGISLNEYLDQRSVEFDGKAQRENEQSNEFTDRVNNYLIQQNGIPQHWELDFSYNGPWT
jgi:hypothetical protein